MISIVKTMGLPFSLVYLILLIGIAYYALVAIPTAIQSHHWIETQGTVTNNLLSITNKQHPRKQTRISVYAINLQYQYSVSGQSFTGVYKKLADRVKNSEKIEQALQNQYAIGASIPVFYNPKHPSESVLQKGLTSLHYVLGLLLMVALITMTYYWIKQPTISS